MENHRTFSAGKELAGRCRLYQHPEQVQREDDFLCQRVQRGLASSSYEPGPLSSLESCMWGFHELLREHIPEVRLPRAPTHFA